MIGKETLKSIIVSQNDLLQNRSAGVMRDKLLEIKQEKNFATIITGIRRSGKSTLLLQLMKKIKKYHYFNFEDSRIEGFDITDFERLNESLIEINGDQDTYFFDEIQVIPKWEVFIRSLLDRERNVIITGSNASLLSRELGTKLTGRHLSYELFPFSYKEFLRLKDVSEGEDSLEAYLLSGGLPEYLITNNKQILQQTIQDILTRDIIVRYNIKSSKTIKELVKYYFSTIGKEFSYNNLKKILNISSVTSVINYTSYLEDSYIFFTIPQFSYSLKKQLVNPKKIYAIDQGIILANSISLSENKGQILENTIFLELKRRNKEIFYYKEKNECDFLIRKGYEITQAIQVCYYLNDENKDREINGLMDAIEQFKLKEGIIITLDQEDTFIINKRKIRIIPAWKWLLK